MGERMQRVEPDIRLLYDLSETDVKKLSEKRSGVEVNAMNEDVVKS